MTESPRWSLRNAHYLNVPGTEWEHNESDRTTGKAVRKLYTVPLLLDPRNPQDCNYPGEVIVCHGDPARDHARDITFLGDPTPDMEPMNDEAETISAAMRPKWEHPIDALPANGGMNSEERVFMAKMMEAFAGAGAAANASVPKAQYDELQERLAKLEAALAAQAKPAAERRV
jgi:hypothetical protein